MIKSRVISNKRRGVVYFLAGFHFLKFRNSNNVRLFLAKVLHHEHSVSERIRGGSRIFFRRGCTRLLLYFNTNKPHFFFSRIPVVLENRRSSQRGGGVRIPCTLPLDPPLRISADLHPFFPSA